MTFDPLSILVTGNEKIADAYQAGLKEGAIKERAKFHARLLTILDGGLYE